MTLRVLSIQPHRVRGGPAIQHLGFLRGLRAHGWSVHAVIPAGHELEAEYRSTASAVHTLPSLPTVPRTTSPMRLAAYLGETAQLSLRLATLARRVDADVVHTFNEAFPAGGLGARYARRASVVHVIGMSVLAPRWVAVPYARVLAASNDRIVCCQQAIRDAFASLGVPRAKLDVVYNSIDAEAVRHVADVAPPVPKHLPLRVGMVAGMDPRKGHLDFVAAAALVCARRSDVELCIVGSTVGNPEYLAAVAGRIAAANLGDRCRLLGAVERVEPWVRSFDVHCVPSLTEALSVAALEAMALARPIVATRVGGNPEQVEDGVTGLLCRAQDPQDLAEKVLALLAAPGRRSAMGAAARARADELFGLERNVALLDRALRDALAARAGRRSRSAQS